jgi:hypothetical protein
MGRGGWLLVAGPVAFNSSALDVTDASFGLFLPSIMTMIPKEDYKA